MRTHGRLEGKVCVVTGTGGSMGRATALAFAREGASVVGCDVSVDAAQATLDAVHDEGGTMVSIAASEDAVHAAVAPHAAWVSIAAINGPESTVISGGEAQVLAMAESFSARGVRTKRLTV